MKIWSVALTAVTLLGGKRAGELLQAIPPPGISQPWPALCPVPRGPGHLLLTPVAGGDRTPVADTLVE